MCPTRILSFVAFLIATKSTESQVQLHNICDLQAKSGPCYARFERFFYNINTHQCESFIYGGCEGNENNFETLERCNVTCAKRICTFPVNADDCKGWYYDTDDMTCLKCNNKCQGKRLFHNKQECHEICDGVKTNPCGPSPDCPPPPPNLCPGLNVRYKTVNGVKCYFGCLHPICHERKCCFRSDECDENQFCYNRCCWDANIDPKPGRCPTSSLSSYQESECTNDTECHDKRKCCPFGTRFYCVDPER